MIVAFRVPTMVENSTDVGIEGEPETSEETPEGFAANSSTSEKVAFMKQSAVTLIYVADAIWKESQAHVEMKKLAKDRFEKIKSLESQLTEEKIISTQLQHGLNKSNEELQLLRKEKELNEQNYSEAIQKVEEFKVLYNKSQKRVNTLEEEIARLTSALVDIYMEKHNMSEQVVEKEQKLQNSEEMIAKQAAELDALKAKIAALEKVVF